MEQKREGGFTLLELLIVIAIIAILSIALVFMLNPAETLKKARDAQRISDLKTVKTALGVMLTATSSPSLDNTFGAVVPLICLSKGDGTAAGALGAKIAYSAFPAPTSGITATPGSDAVTTSTFAAAGYTASSAANLGLVNGNGWIPVNLKALIGGTPISAFPTDPVNTVTAAVAATDLVYRYACQNGATVASGKPAFVFELDAVLESAAYGAGGTDDKAGKDGGDNSAVYEAGNSLNLLPASGAF